MKLHTLLLSTLLISASLASDVHTSEKLTIKQEGVTYIKMLGGALKKELKAHLMADKTGLSAAGFCTSEATSITKKVNAKLPAYAKVRRTALKVRNNIQNKADALDIQMMEVYEDLIKDKKLDPKKEIVIVKDGNTTRVYKPLITKAVCLKCHGSNVSKGIQKIITSAYPHDQAMHFKEGDLRGVIVAEMAKH